MKKLFLFSVVLFLTAQFANAQKIAGSVRGSLKDSTTALGLSDATISVITQKDSALISFTLSSSSGFFEIKNLDTGGYVLLVSYQGYPSLKKPFHLSGSAPVMDFGEIKMDQQYKTLGEVVIMDEAPIKVKGDTIAYRADAFKTKPNATVEDLLKKMPGVQVERDGTVKAQGENVQKIYVDGKEFFGNDPKLATKNLTADMIENVEVYDDMSEQAKFNGVDDGSRTKAINLKLKKNKNKGLFGRASAGYGTDNRYEAALTANYFKGATKLAVIARSNNTNNIGFNSSDMIGGFSMGGRGGGNASGITRNGTFGLNYSDVWGKKTEVTASYFYNNTNTTNQGLSHSERFFPSSTRVNDQQSWTDNLNSNHRFNLRLTYSIDSFSSLVYTPNLSRQNSESYREDSTETFLATDKIFTKQNDSRSIRENEGEGLNWTNNLLYRRRFSKKGRSFSASFSNTYSLTERDGFSNSRIGRYRDGVKESDNLIWQNNIQDNNTNNYGVNLSYTEPIGRGKVVEFNYSYNNNNNESDRRLFDYNWATGKYDVVNERLTNLFENSNDGSRLGTNYRVVKKKYNYQLGIAVQNTLLQSNNLTKDSVVRQRYTNLFPTASFNYQFARSKNLRFNYRGRTNQPSVGQLQEVLDNSNPLFLTRGNASLGQEYINNVNLTYNFFDMARFRNLFLRLSFSNTYNKIVNNIDTLPGGVQLTSPVNANGAYNVHGNFNIGFPIKRMKGGNFNTTTTVNYSRDVSLANRIRNFTRNLNLGQFLRLSYNHKEKLDLGISANINYYKVSNTLQQQKSMNANSSYYMYAYSADASYIFPKNFILSTDLDYTTSTGLAAGYNQSFFLWNASFSKQMLKNNRGELKLSVYDILKQNRSISRNVSENYVEDVQNSVLQRFFMLTFMYNLNKAGGNTQGAGRGGGRNIHIMR